VRQDLLFVPLCFKQTLTRAVKLDTLISELSEKLLYKAYIMAGQLFQESKLGLKGREGCQWCKCALR